MNGCQCPDLCGRDHYPGDGCGRCARWIEVAEYHPHALRRYYVCVECAEEIVARGRGVVVKRERDDTGRAFVARSVLGS